MTNKNRSEYLPLTEATYYILLSLVEPLHGYGIMQNAEEVSNGRVVLGPGTLYGALGKLEKEDLISQVRPENMVDSRRKYYTLTKGGKDLLLLEFNRLKQMVKESEDIIMKLKGG